MKRKEEINKVANDRIKAEAMDKEWVLCYFDAFTTGANWADRTMIEKAIKWMEENLSVCKGWEAPYILERFRKAMEE